MTATITVSGGLTDTPEIRTVGNGTVVNFTVASTERYKKGDDWVDGKHLWLKCAAWRDIAAGIEASLPALVKGTQVTVTGKLHTRQWEADGGKRTSTELEVTDLAVSVKRATVTVVRHDPQARQEARTATNTPPQVSAPTQRQNVAQGGGEAWGAPGAEYPESSPF